MPHNIGEELAKPGTVTMVKTTCGADVAKKVVLVPICNNNIERQIDLMSLDNLDQLIVARKFSLQIDEYVDIAGEPQLMGFVKYRRDDRILEEFQLMTSTGGDIFAMVDNFFKKYNFDRLNCSDVY
ncbi:protein FAM200C-like [Panulirus ornatus]|uniref:protein FAM200C-like n=1 Tax=Panulirus ornatus TaxID=150431 RepID=UPI003A83BAE9